MEHAGTLAALHLLGQCAKDDDCRVYMLCWLATPFWPIYDALRPFVSSEGSRKRYVELGVKVLSVDIIHASIPARLDWHKRNRMVSEILNF